MAALIGGLWKRAYDDLGQRDPELLKDFAETQCFKDGAFESADCLNTLIDEKLHQRQLKQWVLKFADKPFRLRVIGDRIIQTIASSQALIASAASLEPHAALAWTGVSLLLPLLLGPLNQSEAMLSGLEHVTHLVRLYKLREGLYLAAPLRSGQVDFEHTIVDLYSHILEYQARLLWHLSKRSLR